MFTKIKGWWKKRKKSCSEISENCQTDNEEFLQEYNECYSVEFSFPNGKNPVVRVYWGEDKNEVQLLECARDLSRIFNSLYIPVILGASELSAIKEDRIEEHNLFMYMMKNVQREQNLYQEKPVIPPSQFFNYMHNPQAQEDDEEDNEVNFS